MVGERLAEQDRQEVVNDRAARGHNQAADRAQHRRERDGGNDGEEKIAKTAGQQRRRHIFVADIQRATGHGAEPQ